MWSRIAIVGTKHVFNRWYKIALEIEKAVVFFMLFVNIVVSSFFVFYCDWTEIRTGNLSVGNSFTHSFVIEFSNPDQIVFAKKWWHQKKKPVTKP